MKRDIFRRGVRMTHHYGTLEDCNDPFFGTQSFDPQFEQARRVEQLSAKAATPPLEVGTHGEHLYAPARSAVVKPNGTAASFSGPQPDLAEIYGRPIPAGTKRRLGPLKTDK